MQMCSSCFFPLLASVTVNRDYLPVGLSSGKVSASSSCMLQKNPMWQNYENCLVFFYTFSAAMVLDMH